MNGTYSYATATSHVERVRSINSRGTERLDGSFIEKGEAWDARGVVPPSRTVGECAVWVMYLGASG